MGFIKIGDEVKIENIYDGETDTPAVCDVCGKKIITIAMEDGETYPLCTCQTDIEGN